MKKQKWIILAVIAVIAILSYVKISTDSQMKELLIKEAKEKKQEIDSLVSEGKLPEKTGLERKVAVDGLVNMRDLGDVRSENGMINDDMLFRSETLYYLTDKGLEEIDAMQFDVIVDFRGDDEIEHHPNRMPDGVKYVQIPVTNPAELEELIPAEHVAEIRRSFVDGNIDRFNELLENYDIDLDRSKLDRYVEFASLSSDEFSKFLHLLVEEENQKVLFHCEGGKDRTGYAAAVFYKILGVSEDRIMKDFVLTNEYTAEKNAPILEKLPESLYPTIIADEAHLQGTFDYIEATYGDFDTFRKEVLKISDAERDVLIEKYTN
ncbi:tyrosine-protein phosphatase [Wukongibacter baidiensis]|uniref:tyrosine-protein phosphatase n=1 Tax=Wukongibacter baidiensis TaxID=1723361 RepID=UPI003D7F4652